MPRSLHRLLLVTPVVLLLVTCAGTPEAPPVEAESAAGTAIGHYGGRLVAALRSEPATLNPVLAVDRRTQTVRDLTSADLIHINRASQRTEPALAESWEVSDDGTVYDLRLRRDVFFSDGEPFDADDVLFTFEVYLDPAIGSTNRSLLMVEGEPVQVEKVDAHSVRFTLAAPYAVGVRLFDSLAILPEHVLGASYREGTFLESWGLTSEPSDIVGLGPFLPAEYRPGSELRLRRNPNYWKSDAEGNRLPYLDEIVLRFVASEDAAAVSFQAGEIDVLDDISAENFAVLERGAAAGGYTLHDLGPGLSYDFLFFNLNDLSDRDLPETASRQRWFRRTAFRRAVSEAADRESIRRLVYDGRATAIGGPVSGGNLLWQNQAIGPPERSIEGARARLAEDGFSWTENGRLLDPDGEPIEFSIVTNSSNQQRVRMAEILAEDLRQLGMATRVASLEFQSLVKRLLESYEYDACVLALGGGDVDPNSSLSVWLSSGAQHLWAPQQPAPATPWEAEIDELMRAQVSEMDPAARKRQYDRVQEILSTELPLIYLVSPNPLAGGSAGLGNFRPAILDPQTLWNADRLFWRGQPSKNLD